MIKLAFTLCFEFFKIGLFAIGGGPATLPFLMDLTKSYDWFTMSQLTNMVAISESTPGPLFLELEFPYQHLQLYKLYLHIHPHLVASLQADMHYFLQLQ